MTIKAHTFYYLMQFIHRFMFNKVLMSLFVLHHREKEIVRALYRAAKKVAFFEKKRKKKLIITRKKSNRVIQQSLYGTCAQAKPNLLNSKRHNTQAKPYSSHRT